MTHEGLLTTEENARLYAVIIILVVAFVVLLIAFIVAIVLYHRYRKRYKNPDRMAIFKQQRDPVIVANFKHASNHIAAFTQPNNNIAKFSGSNDRIGSFRVPSDRIGSFRIGNDHIARFTTPSDHIAQFDKLGSGTPTPASTRRPTPQKPAFIKRPEPIAVAPAPTKKLEEEVISAAPVVTEVDRKSVV